MRKAMILKRNKWLMCLLLVFLVAIPAAAEEIPQEIPDQQTIAWPGEETVTVFDTKPVFYNNASGLDFYNGRLYAVDNGGGFLWVFEAFPDGSLRHAAGFETGRAVQYASRDSVMGADTEGITVSGEGLVYLAAERDNDRPWKNSNIILEADPWSSSNPIKAMREWDLTVSLPDAAANKGIEAVEWVSGECVQGRITDCSTGLPFDMARYPHACGNGVFFVALETNDQVYAYILNGDGSVVQIAQLDPQLQGVSALEFDCAENALWAAADDRGENMAVKILFGEDRTEYIRILPPEEVKPWRNTEGFSIADESFTRNDRRPVYRLEDGGTTDTLTVGTMYWHVHSFAEVWKTDGQQHWYECNCSERSGEEMHVFGRILTDAAKQSDGDRNHTAVYCMSCRICGYLDTEHTFAVGLEPYPEILTALVARQLYGIPEV